MAKLVKISPEDNIHIIDEILMTCKKLSNNSIRLNNSQKAFLLRIFESKTLKNELIKKMKDLVTKYSRKHLNTLKQPVSTKSIKFSSSKSDQQLKKRFNKLMGRSSNKTKKQQISDDRKLAEKLEQEDNDYQLARKILELGSAALAKGKTFRKKNLSKLKLTKRYRKHRK